jgi:hypothetical protein
VALPGNAAARVGGSLRREPPLSEPRIDQRGEKDRQDVPEEEVREMRDGTPQVDERARGVRQRGYRYCRRWTRYAIRTMAVVCARKTW